MVALADIYDALTNEKCHEKAYSYARALHIIVGGECGAFNPTLIQSLIDISNTLASNLTYNQPGSYNVQGAAKIQYVEILQWCFGFRMTSLAPGN